MNRYPICSEADGDLSHRRTFASWMEQVRPSLLSQLCELIAIPTCTPDEGCAFPWLAAHFEGIGATVCEEGYHAGLATHSDANHHSRAALADPRGRPRVLRARLPACAGPLGTTLFSCHVDVVPPARSDPHGFAPRIADGRVFGRGAADTKGNILMLLASLAYVRDAGLQRTRDVEVDLVGEEEVGGNGALSACLHGRDAAGGAVVLEPTSLEVLHGHRGCLEFTAHTVGRAVHQGSGESGVSAIDVAVDLISELKSLERTLVADARRHPAFREWPRPIQINVGSIAGGEWHGSVPERCAVGGSFGFLPTHTVADVDGLLSDVATRVARRWGVPTGPLEYTGIHNGAYLGNADAPVAAALRRAARAAGVADRAVPRAWNVSCDARLYHDVGRLDTVIFGAGNLSEAHAAGEFLDVGQWEQGVLALAMFLTDGGDA